MAGNSFGNIFKLTTFGESHGPALGGVIDGCPSGIELDLTLIENEMQRRKPGQSSIVTQRKEEDSVTFYSGIFEGKTTGTPIGFLIHNKDQKSKDYSHIKETYRPSHADYVYDKKYGHRDYRGGGRSSARETACRVVAGAIAKQILKKIKINAFVSSVGEIFLNKDYNLLETFVINIHFKPQCEPKYQPVVVDFVNRYGSWSRIFFQKAKTRTINVKKNEYKLNPDSLPFTPEDTRQKAQFNINGSETIKLNTGWVNDNYGEYLQQLFLSEYVSICDYENNEDYASVKVKPSSLKKQVGINDGMMNYTLDFEFSYDMINTVI